MGWKILQQSQSHKKLSSSATLIETFHILTITLLTLLLPLSFLLLARFSTAHYLFTVPTNYKKPQPSSLLFSLFLYSNPALLHSLVSLVSFSALIHGFTGKIALSSELTKPIFRPRLYTAWLLLCTLQVCVGLGIEGSIAAGIDGFNFGHDERITMLSRVVFFLGLHETMLHWWRTVVKPVVDDTVFGCMREEKWVEKVSMAASFGTLWWWRLREEVESLVVVAEVKRNQVFMGGVGVADFVGWFLYYLTVTIGMLRIVKGLMWLVMTLFCRRVGQNSGESPRVEDKV